MKTITNSEIDDMQSFVANEHEHCPLCGSRINYVPEVMVIQ